MPFDFAENVTCSEREIDVQSSVRRVVDGRSSNPQRLEWAVSREMLKLGAITVPHPLQ